MNWILIFIRGSAPAAGILMLGTIVATVVLNLSRVAPIGVSPSQVFAVAVLLAFGSVLLFFWRLRRWEKGAHECRFCAGPLGRFRFGKIFRGRLLDDYRRCYNCNRCTPVVG